MDQPGRKTILLVDDEKAVRETMRGFLSEALYEVAEAENARKALEFADHTKIDLLVTDAMLPNMKGRDLANRIAAQQAGMKVLFVSGYSSDTLIVHGIFPPGAYFIAKPLVEKVFLARVRSILSQGEPWRTVSKS